MKRLTVILIGLSGAVAGGAADQADRAAAPLPDTLPASQPATQPIRDLPPPQLLARARDLLNRGEYEQAVEAYQTLPERDEFALPAFLGLADCFRLSGRYDDLGKLLSDHRRLNEKSSAWHRTEAQYETLRGQYDSAIAAARRALRMDENDHAARLMLAVLLDLIGWRDQAIEALRPFETLFHDRLPESAAQITPAAQGFYLLSVWSRHPNLSRRTRYVLQELLQHAYERLDRTYWPARLAAADLLRSKYNQEQAVQDYEAALAINPNLAQAYAGLGYIALESWKFEEVDERAGKALQINPNSTDALLLRAQCRMNERRFEEAWEACEQALRVNPNSIEALSLAAAARIRLGQPGEADPYLNRVKRINPQSAVMHHVLAEALSAGRQFREAEEHYLTAIRLDPSWSAARADLGLMYMQSGDETKARAALEQAWSIDPFNARTKNTLDMLDKLHNFDRVETDHFVIKYKGAADGVMARYAADYLEGIYHEICDDFGAKLDQKTIIEVFPSHRDFGVRITGQPWIHTVGACTGWVIAMDAPRSGSDLQGTYNFAHVLRHEFTHTVTLAVTENRIPHWMTEGLAVLQENMPTSWDWMQMLADAVRRNELFELENIDWGFQRPKRPGDRNKAYAQSEWMIQYIIARYGYDTIERMLAAFRDRESQDRVFEEVVGVTPEAFDSAFKEYAAKEAVAWGFDLTPVEDSDELLERLVANPDDAGLRARLARAYWDEDDYDNAKKAAEETLADHPDNVMALTVLTKAAAVLAARMSDERKAKQSCRDIADHVKRLAQLDPRAWAAHEFLGRLALDDEDYDQAAACFERLKAACPHNPSSYRSLAGIYLKRNQPDKALGELLQVAATEEHDADVPLKIARIYEEQGDTREAAHWYMEAAYVDPSSVEVHAGLVRMYKLAGQNEAAIREYEALCALEPGKATHPSDLALLLSRMGRPDDARRWARQAAQLDPAAPARVILDGP